MIHTMTNICISTHITYPNKPSFRRLHIPSGMGLSWGMLCTLRAPSRCVSTKHGLLRGKHGEQNPHKVDPYVAIGLMGAPIRRLYPQLPRIPTYNCFFWPTLHHLHQNKWFKHLHSDGRCASHAERPSFKSDIWISYVSTSRMSHWVC